MDRVPAEHLWRPGLRMFQGMSKQKFWDRLSDKNDGDKREIEDWMAGDGSKVMAVMLIALVIWGIVSIFWH